MPRASWVVVLWCAAAEVHYVPIGHGCWPANVLRLHGLRRHALPFDWVVLPLAAVADAIDAAFAGFACERAGLDPPLALGAPEHRQVYADDDDPARLAVASDVVVPAVCGDRLFLHDFASADPAHVRDVQAKYARRARRLLALLANASAPGGDDEVVFVRETPAAWSDHAASAFEALVGAVPALHRAGGGGGDGGDDGDDGGGRDGGGERARGDAADDDDAFLRVPSQADITRATAAMCVRNGLTADQASAELFYGVPSACSRVSVLYPHRFGSLGRSCGRSPR